MVTLKLHLCLKIYFHIEIPFPRIEPVGRIIGLNMVVIFQDAGQTARNALSTRYIVTQVCDGHALTGTGSGGCFTAGVNSQATSLSEESGPRKAGRSPT